MVPPSSTSREATALGLVGSLMGTSVVCDGLVSNGLGRTGSIAYTKKWSFRRRPRQPAAPELSCRGSFMDRPYRHIEIDRTGDVHCVRLCQAKMDETALYELADELDRLVSADGCRKLLLSLGPEEPQF